MVLASRNEQKRHLAKVMPLTVGSRIARYDVTALIGEGGMGQVSRARGSELDPSG